MTPPRLALIGLGKMGRTVMELARDRQLEIVAALDRPPGGAPPRLTRETLAGADVAIDFTEPDEAPANVRACVAAGCPIVVGTTGWEVFRPAVERDVIAAGGAMFWSPNFSLGANVLWRVAGSAATLAARLSAFHAHIIETHHTEKRDAPSGTALELARRTGAALGRAVPTTSIRTGSVPGTHELLLDGAFEQLRIAHVARDRRVFAEGALVAAHWLVGRRGVFTMDDLLDTELVPR